MVTGASTADLAIILIDARNGVLTQSKRHGIVASLLGIPHVVVCVNKMDLVEYSKERYEEIVAGKQVLALLDRYSGFLLQERFVSTSKLPLNGLYRVRNISLDHPDRSCADNFHIPFSLYNWIGTTRFSLPGYPCLYLASSSLLSSREVKSKSSEHQVISRYEMWDGVLDKILYLTWRPSMVAQKVLQDGVAGSVTEFLETYLRLLPFLFVIYHRVQREDGPFRPEYIVSQIMTQWIRLKGINGIAYLSTRVDYSLLDDILAVNFVFPVPSRSDQDYNSDFGHKFSMSRPIVFRKDVVLEHFQNNEFRLGWVDNHGRYIDKEPVRRKNGLNYWNTYHGKTERLLQNARTYGEDDPRFSTPADVEDFEYEKKASWI